MIVKMTESYVSRATLDAHLKQYERTLNERIRVRKFITRVSEMVFLIVSIVPFGILLFRAIVTGVFDMRYFVVWVVAYTIVTILVGDIHVKQDMAQWSIDHTYKMYETWITEEIKANGKADVSWRGRRTELRGRDFMNNKKP